MLTMHCFTTAPGIHPLVFDLGRADDRIRTCDGHLERWFFPSRQFSLAHATSDADPAVAALLSLRDPLLTGFCPFGHSRSGQNGLVRRV